MRREGVETDEPATTSTQAQPSTTWDSGGEGHLKCLSSEPHLIRDVRDLQHHVFGCLLNDRRLEYFSDEYKNVWHHATNLKHDDVDGGKSKEEDKSALPELRFKTAMSLEGELKRIDILRNSEELKDLVDNVNRSRNEWRGCEDYRHNIDSTIQWRQNTNKKGQSTSTTQSGQVDLANSTFEKFREKLREVVKDYLPNRQTVEETAKDKQYNLERDIKAQYIKLERIPDEEGPDGSVGVMRGADEPVLDDIFKGTFPDQHLSVESLLKEKIRRSGFSTGIEKMNGLDDTEGVQSGFGKRVSNPGPSGAGNATQATKGCSGTVRWSHVPCNNMKWVEEAMKKYFESNERNSRQRFRGHELVLRLEYWKGQEHASGKDNIVTSRHLRPTVIRELNVVTDSKISYTEDHQTNIVVFMPFLHWETDRRRSMMSQAIDLQVSRQNTCIRQETLKSRQKRQTQRKKASSQHLAPSSLLNVKHTDPDYYGDPEDGVAVIGTVEDILWAKVRDSRTIAPPSRHVYGQAAALPEE
ncbi:hypothetical protein O1611_g8692 [Lasiodiplodia mahajangana]|uniref:Uncharacterized protein n=1 Tax=Lasiodiplodia mahajangana TaxID=1108764 RepID=A0ACC2JCN3_9PEZI|nr:hypothetical protein O1611_g8692 [Lasiodiplodia mahajangana]